VAVSVFEIARVLVRFDHVADSQKVKEAHLGITEAATLLFPPPKWHNNEAGLD
jgi:hypothetical protein